MRYLILRAYELCCTMLPFCAAFALLNRRQLRQRAPGIWRHARLALVFAFYIFGVFSVTGAGTLYDLLFHGLNLAEARLNLVPFANRIDSLNYGLNVLLLAPFGFLLPRAWPRADSFIPAALGGLGLSLLVELSQLLNIRATDVDDLIMNLLGAVLGFGLHRLLARWPGRAAGAAPKAGPKEEPRPGWQPFFYVGLIFVSRFFLFNELGFARAVFGFFGRAPIIS